MKSGSIFLSIACTVLSLKAQALDAADSQALEKTKEVMMDKQKRQEAVNSSEKAKKADEYAKKVGGQHTEDVYALASKVFEKLVVKYNGDANKIAEVLEKAKKDPAAFTSSEFSPEELAALKALIDKIGPMPAGGK